MYSDEDNPVVQEAPSLPRKPIAGPSAFSPAYSEAASEHSGFDEQNDGSESGADSESAASEQSQGDRKATNCQNCPSIFSVLGYAVLILWVTPSAAIESLTAISALHRWSLLQGVIISAFVVPFCPIGMFFLALFNFPSYLSSGFSCIKL